VKIGRLSTVLVCALVLLSSSASEQNQLRVAKNETGVEGSVSPVIQDVYLNNTWAGQPCQFSFNVTDDVGLSYVIFGCNATQTFTNDTSMPLSGTQAWVNITKTLPSFNCIVSFQLWAWDTNSAFPANTGLRYIKVYKYSTGGWNTPYTSLIDAIKAIDSANNWNDADTYAQTILGKKTTADLADMIDGFAKVDDWIDVLKWSAFCWKLGVAQENDIVSALGNCTMVGSLPYTDSSSGYPDFVTESKWALYGYYWALLYNVSLTKWNVTAAFNQFNSSIYGLGEPALWVYADGTARSYSDRYYDEDACTIECYIIFAKLLNVSGAIDDALHWWSYDDSHHWSNAYQYYRYTSSSPNDNYEYECEEPFFLKIIGTLKYYYPSLGNWSHVLTDIENRYLSSEWNSPQWLDGTTGTTTYVAVHEYKWNNQRRLRNTFGAWQALLGVYLGLNSTYQSNIEDMLRGNDALEPAWALLLRPEAGLYNNETKKFGWYSTNGDNNSTAEAETLMFLLGIVPGSTTTAFPLEELNYEYVQGIGCQMFQLNLTSRTVTLPVADGGDVTFQYGVSPVTCFFNQSGVWQVTFSDSWNMITSVTYTSGLPVNLICFTQILPSEITVTNVVNSKTIIGRGCSESVDVTLDFQNTNSNANITVYANSSEIHSELIALTTAGLTLSFEWNTSGFAYGNYTLEAHAELVQGGNNISNNGFTCPVPVHIGVPGDVSSSTFGTYDTVVNMRDIAYLIRFFNAKPGSPSWSSNADVNGDGVVNLKDIEIALLNFCKHE
jgi:hypothetical protein